MISSELQEDREEYTCVCVGKHVPLPMSYYKVLVAGEVLFLCPTTWYNLNKLLAAYRIYGTVPPGSVRKHYSKFVQDLALELWNELKGD